MTAIRTRKGVTRGPKRKESRAEAPNEAVELIETFRPDPAAMVEALALIWEWLAGQPEESDEKEE